VPDEKAEVGYSVGAARRLGPQRQIGIEAFGNWKHNEHWIGPTVGFGTVNNVKFMATAGIPYAGGGGFQVRFLLEKEF
jgi:hypothetical protein